MRKFLVVLLGLVVLLIIVDRAGLFIAQREVGIRAQSAYDLPARPDVTIQGIPFLTQVASGNYKQIDISIPSVKAGGVQVDEIKAQATDVHASLSLLLGQDSGSVTAANVTGTGMISFAQIQQKLPRGVRISPDGTALNVAGSTPYGVIKGTARLGLSGSGITVTPQQLSIAGVNAGALASKFAYTIPTAGVLPLHLSVTGVQVTQGGVLLHASGHNVKIASA
ncbi:MAG: LmeA family phospholipid-binding protein [Streptosporangiaceae bacterium]